MKTTIRDLAEIKPSIDLLLDARSLDVKTAYAVSKFAAAVDREFKLIEKTRNKYIKDHGKPGPNGPEIAPTSEEWAPFQAAMEELLDQETDIPVTIKISLEKIPQGVLSPRAIAHLDFLISE